MFLFFPEYLPTSIQIFFERQCGPPKSTHYIFGQFYDAMDVDIGENHLAVYLLEDIKVRYTFVMWIDFFHSPTINENIPRIAIAVQCHN